MKLNNELAKQAKIHGICDDWYLQLKNETEIDKMIEMYIKGIDFCLSNNFPSNDFIRKNFKGKMESHGIYLDEDFNVVSMPKVVSLGKCGGIIEADNFDICEIFIKNESNIKVIARANSFIMIDIFDNTNLEIVASDNARVCVNHYGGIIYQSSSDKSTIKIIEKNKKTY